MALRDATLGEQLRAERNKLCEAVNDLVDNFMNSTGCKVKHLSWHVDEVKDGGAMDEPRIVQRVDVKIDL